MEGATKEKDMKKLQSLISFELPNIIKNQYVKGISDNSQHVIENGLFIAVKGTTFNGEDYIQDAIAHGAKFIVCEKNKNYAQMIDNIGFIFVKNVRQELALIASKFFDSKFCNIVAVTGTNGKSSTVDIARQIWIHSQISSASIGTLGVITNDINKEAISSQSLTSPGAIELHKILQKLSSDGVKNVAMEASSHGIEQNRIYGIKFSICAFTNFTQDHLDYHKSMEAYWKAKEKLFSELSTDDAAFVINADDEYAKNIQQIATQRRIKCITYGRKSADIQLISIAPEPTRQVVKCLFFGRDFAFYLPINGEFQVYNALCAAAICYFSGVQIEQIIAALQQLKPINGRLELVTQFNCASIYIDYAHTPDALKNAISSLRKHTSNRIITLFGCGGDRDQSKRISMGKIAEQYSDITIITNDNPRNENPSNIRKMILEGCQNAIEIADRHDAISYAIKMLRHGDSLLIAGKGHEAYQLIGSEIKYFNDKDIILECITQ